MSICQVPVLPPERISVESPLRAMASRVSAARANTCRDTRVRSWSGVACEPTTEYACRPRKFRLLARSTASAISSACAENCARCGGRRRRDRPAHRAFARPRRAPIPLDLLDVIDHHHGAGFGDTRDFRGVGHGRGQQQPGDAAFRHQFRFGERGDADAARPGGELAFGDLDAFVGFRVRAQGLAGTANVVHHAGQVGFKGVQIQEQGWGEDFSFKHSPYASVILRVLI